MGGLPLQLRLETGAHQLAELEHQFVRNEIIDFQTFFAAAEHSALSQDAQMFRSICLCRPGRIDEFRHRMFSRAQGVEQPQAHWLSQDLEAVGNQLKGLQGEGFHISFHGRALIIWLYSYTVKPGMKQELWPLFRSHNRKAGWNRTPDSISKVNCGEWRPVQIPSFW